MNLSEDEPRKTIAVCDHYVVTVTSETVVADNETVRVYGLQFSDRTGVFEHFPDITCRAGKIRELFTYFRRYDVDRGQILDVVEDFIDALHFSAF